MEGPVPYADIFNSTNPYKEVRSRLAFKEKIAAKGTKSFGLKLSDGYSVVLAVSNPLLRPLINLNLNATSGGSGDAAVIDTLFMDSLISAAAEGASFAVAQPEKFRYYRSRTGARSIAENLSATLAEPTCTRAADYQELSKQINKVLELDTKLSAK